MLTYSDNSADGEDVAPGGRSRDKILMANILSAADKVKVARQPGTWPGHVATGRMARTHGPDTWPRKTTTEITSKVMNKQIISNRLNE